MSEQFLTIVFAVVVLGCLVVDLGVLHRRAKVVTLRAALFGTAFWVALALAFAGGIYVHLGPPQAMTFLTGYVIEQSLSVDNLFVFLLIFKSFKTPLESQHRVLFWGIIGALVLRALCIGLGVAALQRFSWLNYGFGAILVLGGIKTAFDKDDDEADMKDSRLVRVLKRCLPERLAQSPLFLTLVVVEVSDLIFAVDSIPAVLAVTKDPFLVYTSNVFAILGLRSIYFALAHMMRLFAYLPYALAVILVFVGVKIGIEDFYTVSVPVTLAVIGGLLGVATVASLAFGPKAVKAA